MTKLSDVLDERMYLEQNPESLDAIDQKRSN